MKLRTHKCLYCDKVIRGNAYYRHVDACRKKHGKGSGKPYRDIIRRIAKKYEGVLCALAKSPEQHQTDLFGSRKGPEEVMAALRKARTRKAISWAMSWAWGWRRLLEKDTEAWPEDRRDALWDEVWEFYMARYEKLRGKAPLLDRERYGGCG